MELARAHRKKGVLVVAHGKNGNNGSKRGSSADEESNELLGMLKQFVNVISNCRDNLLAGAAARAAAVICVQPLDTMKTKLQASTAHPKTVSAAALRAALRRGGGPFSGVVAALLGQVPYGAFTFAAYEVYKTKLAEKLPDLNERVRVIIAACLGDLTGSLWLAPWEGIKQKVQVGMYTDTMTSASMTARTSQFYNGIVSHLLRDLPFRAIQLALFEECRKVYKSTVARDRELDTRDSFVVGAVAGTVTALFTTPLDVIRTRIMSQRFGVASSYSGIADALNHVMKSEGASGLMRGALPRVLAVAPSTAIFFYVYDHALRAIRRNGLTKNRTARALVFSGKGVRRSASALAKRV